MTPTELLRWNSWTIGSGTIERCSHFVGIRMALMEKVYHCGDSDLRFGDSDLRFHMIKPSTV